jgi:RNA-binding protein
VNERLSSAKISKLKSIAQRLDAGIKLGKQGVTAAFLKNVDEALAAHELIKVKFEDFKEQRKELAPKLAEQTSSHLITLIGNVAVLYRQHPDEARRKIHV